MHNSVTAYILYNLLLYTKSRSQLFTVCSAIFLAINVRLYKILVYFDFFSGLLSHANIRLSNIRLILSAIWSFSSNIYQLRPSSYFIWILKLFYILKEKESTVRHKSIPAFNSSGCEPFCDCAEPFCDCALHRSFQILPSLLTYLNKYKT